MVNDKDIIREKLKIELEKLKMTVTIAILLTGGLVGVLYKLYRNMEIPLNIVLFSIGIVSEIICMWYLITVNKNIKKLIKEMGGAK